MKLVSSFLLILSAAGTAVADDRRLNAEVRHLLDEIGASGCQFERNGSVHDAEDAVQHLELKFRRGRRYVDNADEFIERLASESSWTGRPYRVVCADQAELSSVWLTERLNTYRSAEKERAPEGAL